MVAGRTGKAAAADKAAGSCSWLECPSSVMTYQPCAFDIFHGDPLSGVTFADDVQLFDQAKTAGWPMMWHKLSQGAGFVDPRAVGRLRVAVAAGMLIGGYHFMTLTDSIGAQVGNFMRVRGQIDAPMVLALDFEPLQASAHAEKMASAFVNDLHRILGKWPLLYTGRWSVAPIPLDNLPCCPIWLAAYTSVALTSPAMPDGWDFAPTWVQYSDGVAGPNPQTIPGIGAVDQSAFNGSLDEALAWWKEQQS